MAPQITNNRNAPVPAEPQGGMGTAVVSLRLVGFFTHYSTGMFCVVAQNNARTSPPIGNCRGQRAGPANGAPPPPNRRAVRRVRMVGAQPVDTTVDARASTTP